MNELKVTGKIEKINEVINGTSKAGKEWTKISFLVRSESDFNNLFCFEIFGADKVEAFQKFQKVGNNVDVKFNVQVNEWNDKYFTTLGAWSVFKAEEETAAAEKVADDDLSFLN